MMKRRSALLAGALIVTSTGGRAQAASRVALVIGNAAYTDAPLRNPVRDVREVAATLQEIGFAVTTRENLALGPLREALRGFVLGTRTADVRLVYFAGHGFQLRGRNYLVPVAARIENETHVLERTADATELIEQLGAVGRGANVVIIDACRVHPLFAPGTRRMWAVKPGQAPASAPVGTVVAFSTRPGQVAFDGDGTLGVYARHLAREIKRAPGAPVEQLFKRVRAGVSAETGNRQVPWESSDLNGELCLRPAVGGQCVP
jgi:uncharacterized caspase-like protein